LLTDCSVFDRSIDSAATCHSRVVSKFNVFPNNSGF
jgi:hypothetical protein